MFTKPGQNAYKLPTDFHKLQGVDVQFKGGKKPCWMMLSVLERTTLADIRLLRLGKTPTHAIVEYSANLDRDMLYLYPAPERRQRFRLRYWPKLKEV